MVGVATSSALFFPVVRQLPPTRLLMGLSLARYSYLSIWVGIAIAAVLLIAAIAIPQN